jgi:hypothetical protein
LFFISSWFCFFSFNCPSVMVSLTALPTKTLLLAWGKLLGKCSLMSD